MRFSLKPFSLIEVNIPYKPPKKLEALAKKLQGKGVLKGDIVFPPISIEMILEIFLKREFEKLNFFDVMRLLNEVEKDTLRDKIEDKVLFVQLLQKLFNQSPKYIQNFILKKVAIILKDKETHSLKNQLSKNMTSKEFSFIKLCVDKRYLLIQKEINNKSIKSILKNYGVNNIFLDLSLGYSNFLLNEIAQRKLDKANINKYINNLLLEDDLKNLYSQVDRLITFIEKKIYIEEIYEILSKLGNIEDTNRNSKWHTLKIDGALQDRYKKLKGLFEFQRFVKISNYLVEYTDLSTSNLSHSGKTSDADRIENRSTFWSNYDERFSSVKMWVSESDYRIMEIDKPVDLRDIKQLENINNEVCMLEFKENNLLIIEFFRLRDNYTSYKSLVFTDKIEDIKLLLEEEIFDSNLYERLKRDSDYKIHHDFLWQGWVDEFLRRKNIYPNQSILNGKLFDGKRNMKYTKARGLQDTRDDALSNNDRVIRYEDVILTDTRTSNERR